VEKVEYHGWKNNLRITNGQIELIATLDVGPRIIHFGFCGGENAFKVYRDQLGRSGEKTWQIRGGHRLWHSPEAKPRTYFPDNDPVAYKQLPDGGIRLTPPPETPYSVQKEIDIYMDPAKNRVRLVHRITNVGAWPIELAPWALTVLEPGGIEIIPLPEKIPHEKCLLPNQILVLWSYTDLADPRYHFGTRYITLRHDPNRGATKIGLAHRCGWIAYLRNGLLFVKRFEYKEGQRYPDFGCNFETFTNQDMLECESLGPLTRLEPGQSVEHEEVWELYKDVPAITPGDEASIDRAVRSIVEKAEQ